MLSELNWSGEKIGKMVWEWSGYEMYYVLCKRINKSQVKKDVRLKKCE